MRSIVNVTGARFVAFSIHWMFSSGCKRVEKPTCGSLIGCSSNPLKQEIEFFRLRNLCHSLLCKFHQRRKTSFNDGDECFLQPFGYTLFSTLSPSLLNERIFIKQAIKVFHFLCNPLFVLWGNCVRPI